MIMKVMKSNWHRTLIIVFGIICIFSYSGLAEDVSFEATVDRNWVPLGSSLQLTLTIYNAPTTPSINFPSIDGFQVSYIGPSTKVTIINGQYEKTSSYNYRLMPERTGKLSIPALTIDIGGKKLTSESIAIDVTDFPTTQPSVRGGGDQQQTKTLQDRINLVLQVPRGEIFLHERIPVKVFLYVNNLSIRNEQFPELEGIGFSVEDYQRPRQYQQNIGGVRHDILEFATYITPTRTGTLTLGPANLECSILQKRTRSRSSLGSIFSDDFFDDFFTRVERHPVVVQSNDLTLKVLPLPSAGRPANFNDAVGQYQFSFSASPLEVNVGDPVTVRMKVSGQGNLKTVKMPSFKDSEQFKVYAPQIKTENGNKILEQVLIPKSENVEEIPAVTFYYFDPEFKSYKSITKGPTDLNVAQSENDGELRVVGQTPSIDISQPEKLGRDIVFIKDKPGKIFSKGTFFYKSLTCKLLFIFITIIFIVAYAVYAWFTRVQTDVAYARRLRAPKRAKVGLHKAKGFLSEGKYQKCYDCLFKTSQDYFGDKFHLPSQGLTYKELEHNLRRRHIDGEFLDRIKLLFEECDEARFGSVSKDADKVKSSLQNCEEIFDFFERKVR